MKLNPIERINKRLLEGNKDDKLVRTLYIVMQKVGGYNVLCGEEWEEEYSIWRFKFKKKVIKKGISIMALHKIIKCIDEEYKEQEKAIRKR